MRGKIGQLKKTFGCSAILLRNKEESLCFICLSRYGKTTLAKKYTDVVDLEMSDIKYDNSSVRHLTKEERKSTKRPLKDKRYKTIYVNKAYTLHRRGKQS